MIPTRCSTHPVRLARAVCGTRPLATVALMLSVSPVTGTANAQAAETVTPAFIEEITVTARKRAESLQDVPIAMSVLQGADLESRGMGRLKEVQGALPNVSLADSANSNSNTTLVVRGISSNARNAGFESGIGLYVDGVYMGRPVSFNQDLVDIERLEVLRGPQGTLFGKNTIAGAISITTVKPDNQVDGKVAVEYGNLDYLSASGTLNLPLVDEMLTARVSAFAKSRDGVVENLPDGRRFNDEGAAGGRVQLRWQPSDSATVDLSMDYLDEDRSQSFPETLDDPLAPGPRTTINDFDPAESRTLSGGSVTAAFDLRRVTLTSITAYRNNRAAVANDNDNTAADLLVADFRDEQQQFTQELRLTSPGGERVDYVAGLFYFLQDADQDHRGTFGSDFPLTGGTDVTINSLASVDTTSYAAYADVQLRLSERLQLLAGLRYTFEKKDLLYAQTGELLPAIIFRELAPLRDSISDSDLSPQLGLSFKLSDAANAYVKAARGYKSGGWNADFIGASLVDAAAADNSAFSPSDFDFAAERATTYEAGIKATAFDRGLVTNAAAFYTDYEDLQVSQFLGVLNGGTVITNAGQARIQGVELELTAYPWKALRLDASVGYLDAEFREYANCQAGTPSCAGKRLPDAPRWTASGGLEFFVPAGSYTLAFRGDYTSRSSSFTTPTNVSALSIDSYGLVNLQVSLTPQERGLGGSVWVRNLLDKDYLTGAVNDDLLGSGRTFVGYGLPRTYGVRLQYTFR